MSFTESLESALLTTPVEAQDEAAVHLARQYAEHLDDEGDLTKIGPLLLQVLAQLGMTPKSRAAVVGGAPDDGQRNPLDELRARRAARQHASPAMD